MKIKIIKLTQIELLLWQIVNATTSMRPIMESPRMLKARLPNNQLKTRNRITDENKHLEWNKAKCTQKRGTAETFRLGRYDITIQNRITTYGMPWCMCRCMILLSLTLSRSGSFQCWPSSKSLTHSFGPHRRIYHYRRHRRFHKTRIQCLWNKEHLKFSVFVSVKKMAK